MFERLLDRVGDWNPQLWREITSRVSLPSILTATLISAIAQFIAWYPFSPYFLHAHMYSGDVNAWQWIYMLQFLDREIWLGLTIGGIYLIASNFRQELHQRTFNLVNLSPTSTREIIVGKILGVPIILYWGVFLTIPFHLIAIHHISCIAYHFLAWNVTGGLLIIAIYLITIILTVVFNIFPIILTIIMTAIGWFLMDGLNTMGTHWSPRVSGSIDPCNFSSCLYELSAAIGFAIVIIACLNTIVTPISQSRKSNLYTKIVISFPIALIWILFVLCSIVLLPMVALGWFFLIWLILVLKKIDRQP